MRLPKNLPGISNPSDGRIEKYVEIMQEIKKRTEVIDFYLGQLPGPLYPASALETLGLQFRKVFELILFASLSANRKEYAVVHADFEKHYKADELLKSLRKLNPKFYPEPIVEKEVADPRVKHDLSPRRRDYLNENDLNEAYLKCGTLMHAAKPFGDEIDYAYYQARFPIWRQRFVNLLNNHIVHMIGDGGFWVIHMQEEGHDRVTHTRFEPADPL